MPLIPNLSLYLIQKFDRLALWGNLTILELHYAETQALLLNAKYSGFLAVVVFFAIIIAVEKIYDLICPAICVNIGTSGFNPGFVLYYLVVGFILFGVSGWMADKKLSV